MNPVALPASTDHYIWMLHDGTEAVVADPGDAGPVPAARSSLRLQLAPILVTHPHPVDADGGAAWNFAR